jgi:hypothetical protein
MPRKRRPCGAGSCPRAYTCPWQPSMRPPSAPTSAMWSRFWQADRHTIAQPPEIDPLLPTCDHPNAAVLHARRQVWVHIAFNRYRAAYRKAFPEEAIAGKVLSHAMNRRTAALKGFDYVRLHRFRAAAIPAADSRNNGACHCMDHPRNRQCAGSARPLFITAQDLRSLKSPPPCQPR